MTPQERRRFVLAAARAVTRDTDRVLLLRADGDRKRKLGVSPLAHLEQLAEVDPARFDRLSFAVQVDTEIVALDADTPDAVVTARAVTRQATQAGVEPVVIASGRPGNVHVFLRVADAELRGELIAAARAGGVDVRDRSPIRPPLSSHPGGLAVELLEPTDPADALARLLPDPRRAVAAVRELADERPVVMPSRSERRQVGPPLSAAMDSVMRNGDGNPDRSVTLQRVVTAMVNRGWTLDQAWWVLQSRYAKCASKLHERRDRAGEEAAYKYLAHCWMNAEMFCAANPPDGVDQATVELLDRLQATADSTPWAGEGGSSAWMVLHQLIEIGRRGGGMNPSASERQLAEAASMTRAAVHSALQRLMDDGWLRRIRSGSGPKATLWALPTKPRLAVVTTDELQTRRTEPLPQPSTPNPRGCEASGVVLRASLDAFRRSAIGSLGYRILRHLMRHGNSDAASIAAALGCHPRSVTRILRTRLGAVGLVARGGRTWSLLEVNIEEALEWAAEKFGTIGAGERQRRWHELERAMYRLEPTWGADLEWWSHWEAGKRATAPPGAAAA